MQRECRVIVDSRRRVGSSRLRKIVYKSAMAVVTASVDATGDRRCACYSLSLPPCLSPSLSRPPAVSSARRNSLTSTPCQGYRRPTAHRVPAGRHVPMLLEPVLVLPYQLRDARRRLERGSGSESRPSLKLSRLVTMCKKIASRMVLFGIYRSLLKKTVVEYVS